MKRAEKLRYEWGVENKKPFDSYVPGSHFKALWECKHGHRWQAQIRSRYRGTDCPYCSGRCAIPGETDLQTVDPKLSAQWDPENNEELTPMDVTPYSNLKVWWRCEKGHSWQASVAKRSEAVAYVIREIFEHNKGRYGVRRVHHELINRGYKVNHKKVQRLMHCMDLVGKVADNLINRDFSTTKPLQKWTTDVSQFNLSWGKCYLSPILDMHTNEVISYDLSLSPNMEQIRRMLEKGLSKFSSLNGLIFHSDQGWQYQHAYFRKAIEKRGIIQSMSRKGNCYDNSIMETFFGRLKNEMFYGCEKEYKSYEEFSTAMAKYIDYYNNERIQAKTKWMPPAKYRLASMG